MTRRPEDAQPALRRIDLGGRSLALWEWEGEGAPVLLVHATMDEVIRRPHQDLLWESLGRPRRLLFPLGHTTAALAIDPILDAAASFFREREPVAPSVAAGPVSRWR